MAPLGKNQLDFLMKMSGMGRAVIVGDKLIRSLCDRGLLVALSTEGDSFFVLTPNGLRAIADAIDSGALKAPTIDDFKRGAKS